MNNLYFAQEVMLLAHERFLSLIYKTLVTKAKSTLNALLLSLVLLHNFQPHVTWETIATPLCYDWVPVSSEPWVLTCLLRVSRRACEEGPLLEEQETEGQRQLHSLLLQQLHTGVDVDRSETACLCLFAKKFGSRL